MMQLLELNIRNYKFHNNKRLVFNPGVTGIVGKNGSGKSSIISAICFLFTGEVDVAKKADCITLGSTEGWVKGKFLLNDKEGILERHLTGSRVSLTYDGMTYNKVSEVNQLWNDLLQIDSTIFNNVIVAKQGEIQNLFNDESAVREKIFQKIFMVPPTEKIRNIIWDNYIKVCPPEKPEEDVQLLMSIQSQVAGERNHILAEIDENMGCLADETTLRCIEDRIEFLEKCISDSVVRPGLEESLGGYLIEQENIRRHLIELGAALEGVPFEELSKSKNSLLEGKSNFTRKQSIVLEVEKLVKLINPDGCQQIRSKLGILEKYRDERHIELAETNARLKDVLVQKNRLDKLRGYAVCPTCNQDISNTAEHLSHLITQEIELKAAAANINAAYQSIVKQVQALHSELARMDSLTTRKKYLEEELGKIKDAHYSEEEYQGVCQSLQVREEVLQEIRERNIQQTEINAEIRVLQEKIKNLAIYDGKASIDEELPIHRIAVQAFKQTQEKVGKLQLSAGKLEHELVLLDSRIATSQENGKYNARRKQYLDTLKNVYEVFATHNFPRQLIASYMDTVQSSLSKYLGYFNIPYRVKVTDGFKIRLFNSNSSDPLPEVSGGQEMMIGICLRLALHKMFAGAFPIWIIDEGTTHLSDDNRQSYFELIDELRSQKVINQIIIIDHDPKLIEVVDNIIQL
jgi:DNA repair exonuclease SbcCD ATPase subunit